MAMHEHPSHTIRFDLAVVPRRWGCNLWDAVNLIDAAKGTLVLSTTQVPTYSYSIRGYPVWTTWPTSYHRTPGHASAPGRICTIHLKAPAHMSDEMFYNWKLSGHDS